MMDPEVLRQEILEEIAEAFREREMPINYSAFPLPDLMDALTAKQILRAEIIGKHWSTIDAEELRWTLPFISDEALCFYTPAVLTQSLIKGEEAWWFEIQCDNFGSRGAERLRNLLTVPERLVIARYIDFFIRYIGCYTEQDYKFWRYSEDAPH